MRFKNELPTDNKSFLISIYIKTIGVLFEINQHLPQVLVN